jgi:hypothetical protein
MTLICGQLFSERAIADQGGLHIGQEHPASKFAHGGSIRLLLLAYECHVKSKFHVVRGGAL